ncbi:hypothetical protein [Nonomuraea longicatena]|uniref:Uncharacterized protein n=1 Tax=Nonomuraea longicatena TaxID=83682 RepID=A0ABP3ZCC3_9ACTN
MQISPPTMTLAGIILITVPGIAFGGLTLLKFLMRGEPGYLDNPVRRGLWRAGHAHAGVLVLFSLVALLFVEASAMAEWLKWTVRVLIAAAPILMPLGFFLSVLRPGDTRPNRLIWLTKAGGASLALGTLTLGVGLLL